MENIRNKSIEKLIHYQQPNVSGRTLRDTMPLRKLLTLIEDTEFLQKELKIQQILDDIQNNLIL